MYVLITKLRVSTTAESQQYRFVLDILFGQMFSFMATRMVPKIRVEKCAGPFLVPNLKGDWPLEGLFTGGQSCLSLKWESTAECEWLELEMSLMAVSCNRILMNFFYCYSLSLSLSRHFFSSGLWLDAQFNVWISLPYAIRMWFTCAVVIVVSPSCNGAISLSLSLSLAMTHMASK